MRERRPIRRCPCCGYRPGSSLPKHCPEVKKSCGWVKCKDCGARITDNGARHFVDGEHQCGQSARSEEKAE